MLGPAWMHFDGIGSIDQCSGNWSFGYSNSDADVIYLRWFARPDRISTEPYYELPLPVTKLRSIFHFRVGAHSLPVEQGRIEMPKVPRHLRRCTFCATNAIGDERHCLFDCPHFLGLRQQHAMIFRDSHDAMRSVMWHKDQKSVCALVLAIVNEAQTL